MIRPFCQSFVSGQHQAVWIAPGIGHMQEFQIRDHVLIVERDAVKLFQQVKRNMRLPVFNRRADDSEITGGTKRVHFVPQSFDILFRSPGHRLYVPAIDRMGRDQVSMHEQQDAQPFHTAIPRRPPLRNLIVRTVNMAQSTFAYSSVTGTCKFSWPPSCAQTIRFCLLLPVTGLPRDPSPRAA